MEEKTREQKIEERVSDFKQSFESGPGMRTYKYLSNFCLENRCTYVEGSDKSAFNEGARSVILEIRHWLDYNLMKNVYKEQENE